MVNITARGWVVGVVIAVLQTFDSVRRTPVLVLLIHLMNVLQLAGLRYKISFPSGDGQGSPQVGEFPHDPAYVRPK